MAYNFDRIYSLSNTKELIKLSEEWYFFREERREEGLCICGHHMKYVEYFVNIHTGHVIQVGKTCRKKLRLTLEGSKLNAILRELIEGSQLGYTNIFDLLRYSEESRKRLIQLVKLRIDASSNIATLQILLKELLDLVDLHTQNTIICEYINQLIEKVNLKIKGIEMKEKEQREQREKEQREKEQREKEQREQREKERREKEQREKEQREQREKEWKEEEKKIAIQLEEYKKKWAIECEEMKKREREKEEYVEDVKKEEVKEKTAVLESKKKESEEFWNKFTKPSNPSPKEP